MIATALCTLALGAAPVVPAGPSASASAVANTDQLKTMMRSMHRVGSAQAQVAQPVPITSTWTRRAVSFLGILVMIALALLLSERRRSVPWRLVGIGCCSTVFGVWCSNRRRRRCSPWSMT